MHKNIVAVRHVKITLMETEITFKKSSGAIFSGHQLISNETNGFGVNKEFLLTIFNLKVSFD